MALQMVRSFFGQGTPSRSRVHEPVIDSESFGNQEYEIHIFAAQIYRSPYGMMQQNDAHIWHSVQT